LLTALGYADWFTARVTTLGELNEAMKSARAIKMIVSNWYTDELGNQARLIKARD
jgi:hypothetical protein